MKIFNTNRNSETLYTTTAQTHHKLIVTETHTIQNYNIYSSKNVTNYKFTSIGNRHTTHSNSTKTFTSISVYNTNRNNYSSVKSVHTVSSKVFKNTE